jgi:hypothetical protein
LPLPMIAMRRGVISRQSSVVFALVTVEYRATVGRT